MSVLLKYEPKDCAIENNKMYRGRKIITANQHKFVEIHSAI